MPPKRYVTDFDCYRLETLILTARNPGSSIGIFLDRLAKILKQSEIVAPEKIPRSVVTMNSRVLLKDIVSNEELNMSLVFPTDADHGRGFDHFRVSILTPIGLSVFGRKVTDLLCERIQVQRLLYQPEAAGHFNL